MTQQLLLEQIKRKKLLNKHFLREIAESLLGVKLGAGEGLLPSARTLWMPSARTLWMPPRGLYTPQEVDRQQ